MNKLIIGKCDMCGIDMIVGTPIEDKIVCHNCYVNYEKDKMSFLQELINKQKQQISDLQSQLAEKNKEIEELKMYKKGAYEKYIHKCEYLQGQIKDLYKKQNQKAIEQLEKVKEWCENHKSSDEYDYVIAYELDKEDTSGCVNYLKEEIDKQIKQLKDGK